MGFIGDKEEQGKKLLCDAGLLNYRNPHGFQVQLEGWLRFFAEIITIEDEQAITLQYTVYGGNSQSSFATVHDEEPSQMRVVGKTSIILGIPQFRLFVTGDLAFYADSLGKHSYCSYCCIYCTLNRLQWNYAGHPKGDLLTDALAHDIQMQVMISVKAVDIAKQKGISSLPQCKSLTADISLLPSLHLQIGMKNTAVLAFATFVEEEVEQKSEADLESARKVTAAEGDIDCVKLASEADALKIIMISI
jgi:hypothetical protein